MSVDERLGQMRADAAAHDTGPCRPVSTPSIR